MADVTIRCAPECALEARLLDDLVKVFPDEAPVASAGDADLSVFRGDRLSLQLALRAEAVGSGPMARRPRFYRVSAQAPEPVKVTLRSVECVPVLYPAHADAQGSYLRRTPGLYPDLLMPLEDGAVALRVGLWRSIWIDVEVPPEAEPGALPIEMILDEMETGARACTVCLAAEVLPFVLPKQTFPRTEWFHADCLADWYGVEVFSDAHFQIIENFVRAAVRRGINMILTPQFTPPLDTAVGRERTTTQLVDIFEDAPGRYRFDFSKLERWIAMCRRCGVLYFEMSHLFSQWGAVAAPKVVVQRADGTTFAFGWDTPATGEAYRTFMRQYLPELRAVLRRLGVEQDTFFHISDEPHLDHLESYRAAKALVEDALRGCRFIEALSDYEFYKNGLVSNPVCATDRIAPFLENDTPGLWSYYCTAQSGHVSNCFIAQPSGRTRLYGAQMYRSGIQGSLRWGYNFYNSADSYCRINPFLTNDSGGFFPAGDPFIVYPGPDGQPLESIRMMVLDDAIRDLTALCALEARIGREATVALLEADLEAPLTFDCYPDAPDDAKFVLAMRSRVNRALSGIGGFQQREKQEQMEKEDRPIRKRD